MLDQKGHGVEIGQRLQSDMHVSRVRVVTRCPEEAPKC